LSIVSFVLNAYIKDSNGEWAFEMSCFRIFYLK
jgi:hypothetical protein